MVFYFAYGSNMDEERMKSRQVYIKQKFRGVLSGWKLVFNKIADSSKGTSYANIIYCRDSKVEGIIYETDEISIKNLNRNEGVPKHYKKRTIKIKDDYNQVIDCVVYIANPSMVKEGLKPTKEYLNYLLKGEPYLSKEYLEFLKNIKTIG